MAAITEQPIPNQDAFREKLRFVLDRTTILGPIFILPAITYIAVMLGFPLLLALYYSVTNISVYNLNSGYTFVGLKNFSRLLGDSIFRQALWNTFIFAISSQILAMVLGKIMALLLMKDFRGKSIVRVLVLLPWAVPIALGILGWKWMFDSLYSVINWTAQYVGILGPDQWPQWLGIPNLAMLSIIIVFAWKSFPFAAVIFLAAMTSIPQDIIDASEVDGAGFWRKTFQVNLPLIMPIVGVGLVFGIVFAFSDMGIIWLLTKGGPINTTHVLSSYAFQIGILSGDIASGAAISIYLLPILLIAMVLTLRNLQRREF